MLRATKEDYNITEGPMHGESILGMQGLPDEATLVLWMEMAGMNKGYDGTSYDTNDQLFSSVEEYACIDSYIPPTKHCYFMYILFLSLCY